MGKGEHGANLRDPKAIKADWSEGWVVVRMFENLIPKNGWKVIECYINCEPPPHLPTNENLGGYATPCLGVLKTLFTGTE